MKSRSILAAAALAVLGVACGGGGTNVTVTGNVRGQPLMPHDAISAPATITTGAGTSSVAAIIITNDSGLCALVGANKEPKNSQFFLMLLGELNQTTGAITAASKTGTYTVYAGGGGGLPPSQLAVVIFTSTNNTCKDPLIDAQTGNGGTNAITGTVKLTGIDNGAYTGTFDMMVKTLDSHGTAVAGQEAEHVTGTFNTSRCDAVSVLVSSNRTSTCI